ncbi:Hypp9127 [Branchiostoma lanceolatum]|uniref:Hypp9127 protein n=1 Tax=Branchiostoma lanceolatum TaxID=7740 RepID=A0A8J9ZEK2_BRALA|nr:Hypp9127 [Branchiostoma lanceolatum]
MSRGLALVVLLGLVGAISAQSYKGCYKRKWGTFRTRETSDDMTNKKCVEICAKEGLPYAGTYETKCGCESAEKFERLDKMDDSDCTTSCRGDDTQKCGQGNGRLTVWTTVEGKREMTAEEDVEEETRGLEALSYKGCYKRKWGTFRAKETSDDMTNQKCVEICAKEGLPYAGTYVKKCGCESAEKFRRLRKTFESECFTSCGGDVTQKCGQSNGRLSVYATGNEKREMAEGMEEVKEHLRELIAKLSSAAEE